ncbi:hypothetical protein ACFFRR_010328 [Megaselia abdita]
MESVNFGYKVVIVVVFIFEAYAQRFNPDCSDTNDNTIYVNEDAIDLDFDGINILLFSKPIIDNVVSSYTNENDEQNSYLEARLNKDKDLEIITTSLFPSYIEHNTKDVIVLTVKYSCGLIVKTWEFYQTLNSEKNYYDPVFEEENNDINVPIPLYQNIDISVFSKKNLICATDKDLKHYEITFSSTTAKSHDIRVETKKLDGRRYCASLFLEKIYMNISETIEIDLIATDSGKPPRSTSTKLSLTSANDFPIVPDFDNAIYTGNLDEDFKLLSMEPIIINHYNEKVTVEKTGQDADLFNINLNGNKVTVTLAKDLTEEDVFGNSFLSFELKVSNSDLQAVSSAGIVVSVPIKNKISKFLQPLYDGKIEPPTLLTLESIIFKTEEQGNIDFSLERPDSKYFDLILDPNNQEISLALKRIDNSWRDARFLEVQVLAKLGDQELATTEVVIEVYEEENHFEESIYQGLISFEGELELVEMKYESNTPDKVNFVLKGEDSQFFNLESENNVLVLTMKNSNVGWKGRTFLTVQVNAVVNENLKATTEVLIDVLQAENKFEETLYEGSVTLDNSLDLDRIRFRTDRDKSNLNFELRKEDAAFFDLLVKEGKAELTLTLKTGIDPKVWKYKEVLSVQIVAEIESEFLASSDVVVKINKDYFAFGRPYYEGSIDFDGSLTIEAIIFSEISYTDEIKFSLEGFDSKLFDFTQDSNKLQVNIAEDSADIPFKDHLSFIVMATTETQRTSSAVLITIPESDPVPKFEKAIYTGNMDYNGALELEDIVIIQDTLKTSTNFILVGNDDGLFKFTQNGNKLKLSLARTVTNEDLKKDDSKYLKLEAFSYGSKGETSISITMPFFGDKTVFKMNLFQFSSENSNQPTTVGNIYLLDGLQISDYTFSLLDDVEGVFELTPDVQKNVLVLNQKKQAHKALRFSTLTITSTDKFDERSTGSTIVTVALPDIDDPNHPHFDKTFYKGDISFNENNETIFTIDEIEILSENEINEGDIILTFEGDEEEWFKVRQIGSKVELIFDHKLAEEDLFEKQYFELNLKIASEGGTSNAFVIVDIPKVCRGDSIVCPPVTTETCPPIVTCEPCPTPKAETCPPIPTCEPCQTCEPCSTAITCPTDSTPTTCPSAITCEPCPTSFTCEPCQTCEPCPMTCPTVTTSSTCEPCQTCEPCPMTCPTVTTCPSVIPCEPCPVSTPCPVPDHCPTPAPPSDFPVFQKDLYVFDVFPAYTGSLGFVQAETEMEASLKYTLIVVDEYLRGVIDINPTSGELTLTGFPKPGQFKMAAFAENVITKASNKTEVLLRVEAIIPCDDHAMVSHALLVKEIEEEKEEFIIGSNVEGCIFEVIGSVPSDEENPFFKVDKSTQEIVSRKIDREADVFKNMIKAQIQLTVRLNCPEELRESRSKRSIFEEPVLENNHLLYLDDIPLKIDTTIISVILKDINDNAPVFVVPSSSDPIGYPDSEVNQDILPDYLIKVKAIDKDEAFNASINYFIEDNGHFGIQSDSGIIYPYSGAMKGISELDLVVFARDRNGTEGFKEAKVTVKVKKLGRDHLALMMFKSSNIENFYKIQSTIKQKTSIDLNYLRNSFSPGDIESERFQNIEELRRSKRDTPKNTIILRVWGYSFKEGGSPMFAEEIKAALKDADEDELILVNTYDELKFEKLTYISKSQTGFIVSLSIVSVIMTICIGILIWWFALKPYLQKRRSEKSENIQHVSITNAFNRPSLEFNSEHDSNYEDTKEKYKQRESMRIQGNTLNETSDETRRDSVSSEDSNESLKKTKATVTFNELVERIHIEDEHIGNKDN